MDVRIKETYDEISDEAAQIVLRQLQKKPDSVLKKKGSEKKIGKEKREK